MQQDFRIVFEHHGDQMPELPVGISVVNADGANRCLLRETGSMPSWSPSGKWIAFQDVPTGYEGYATNVHLMRGDGCQVRQITHHKDAAACRPRWSRDSRLLLYSLWIDQQYQMLTVHVDSGKVQHVSCRGSYAYPEWTPEGNIVALDKADSPSTVVIMSADGGNIRPCPLFQPGDEEMVWSPDGSKIAFNRYGSLCFVNSDGTGHSEFSFGCPGKAGVLGISWFPDGSGVAFSGEISGDNAGKELFHFDLSSSRERPVVTNPCAGNEQKTRKRKYAEIIDVSCSPFLDVSRAGGWMSWLFGKKS